MIKRQLMIKPPRLKASAYRPIGGRVRVPDGVSQEVHVSEIAVRPWLSVAKLAMIADEFDADRLDEARPPWGDSEEDERVQSIEIVSGRGGKPLLTLGDCFLARAAMRKFSGR